MTRLERLFARLRQERLRLRECLLPRIDRATEVAIGRFFATPQNRQQIVQPHDRFVRVRSDDVPVLIGRPITGRPGQHQIARLGIHKHISHAPQPGEREHRRIKRLVGRLPAHHFAFEPRQRNIPQPARLPRRTGRRSSNRQRRIPRLAARTFAASAFVLSRSMPAASTSTPLGYGRISAVPPPFSAHVSFATVDSIRSISESKSAFAAAASAIVRLCRGSCSARRTADSVLLLPPAERSLLTTCPGGLLPGNGLAWLLSECSAARQREGYNRKPRRQTTAWPHEARERTPN